MPAKGLKGKNFISLADFSREELLFVLEHARRMKRDFRAGRLEASLAGKCVALIFMKPSTRTRVSFEAGVYYLGGHPLVLGGGEMQVQRGESWADTGRVLGRYVDGIVIRTFARSDVIDLAEAGGKPVINGLTDDEHPCQIVSDLLTIQEKKGALAGVKVCYVGDGNNVAHSLLLGCALAGLDIRYSCPPGNEPDESVVSRARELAHGTQVEGFATPYDAASGADVIYTDVWTSMGQNEDETKLATFSGFQVNAELVAGAASDVAIMHCLPAHRGEEISADVLDGPLSAVWDQAENRLFGQMAIMALIF